MPLTTAQIGQITTQFLKGFEPQKAALGGRITVKHLALEDFGNIVIKAYRRGGLLGRFVSSFYLRLGADRALQEALMLQKMAELEIPAPQPVAHATRGRCIYRAWLVMREIENSMTLVELYRKEPDLALYIIPQLVSFVKKLIQNHILHVDLHPGNVLVDQHRKLYLIDFDKAHIFPFGHKRLIRRYCKRWQQAVTKHHLAKEMSALFIQNFDIQSNGRPL